MKSKRIISAVLAAVMAMSFFGCGKKETAKITDDISQPDFENGTAVIEYPSQDSDGNETVVTKIIETPSEYKTNADGTQVTSNSSVQGSDSNSGEDTGTTAVHPAIKSVYTNPLSDIISTDEAKQNFIANTSNDYNISKEDAKKIAENSEKWIGFYCNFYVVNTNKQRISTKEIQVEAAPDIIVNKNLDCEFNFKPGNGMTLSIYGYVNSDKYSDDQSLLKALNSMNIQLVYALTDETSIDDWSKVTTKTMKIKF